jgi:hypothetical protein
LKGISTTLKNHKGLSLFLCIHVCQKAAQFDLRLWLRDGLVKSPRLADKENKILPGKAA